MNRRGRGRGRMMFDEEEKEEDDRYDGGGMSFVYQLLWTWGVPCRRWC
jgi:hypothetical protein